MHPMQEFVSEYCEKTIQVKLLQKCLYSSLSAEGKAKANTEKAKKKITTGNAFKSEPP